MIDSSEFLFVGSKTIEIKCVYCHTDIIHHLRIQCQDCSSSSSSFNLCLNCYSSGVEINSHKSNHSYRINDCIYYPLFQKDWNVLEELLLLEGIEKYGLGNWKVISEYLGTKTSKVCENHYWNDYLGRFGYCLPVNTLQPDKQTQVTFFTLFFYLHLNSNNSNNQFMIRFQLKVFYFLMRLQKDY